MPEEKMVKGKMKEAEAKKEINHLRNVIERHNKKYYVDAAPEISDQEYDRLFKKLEKLEEAFPKLKDPASPTQRVGGEPLKEFNQVKHSVPMLSLDNTYSMEELKEFDQRVKKNLQSKGKLNDRDLFEGGNVEYFVEEKIDGVSIALRYENGRLVLGATRGDGARGDDITENLKTISDIPLQIPARNAAYKGDVPAVIEIRGEAYLSHEQFQRINKEKGKAGEDLFANPRNACAGSLKLLDPKTVASRKLKAFVHGLAVYKGKKALKSQSEAFRFLADLGFKVVPNSKLVEGIEAATKYIESFEKKRETLNYDIDGMVVKVDAFEFREVLGQTTKAPRWMIAYKYQAERAETALEDIKIQVGRTGVLTPVANLKPVLLAGTRVSRASLHNADEIKRLDARIGDTVIIEKSGDIIPKVIEVLTDKRKKQLAEYRFPDKCPVCSEKIQQIQGEVARRCMGLSCPAQLKARVRHFVSRDAMDIEGLGTVWVDQFVDKGLIKDLSDIYYLDRKEVRGLERMGEKSTDRLFEGIEKSKKAPLHRVIFGLGIPDVGQHAAYILAQRFQHLEKLAGAAQEELESIREIGPVTADSIHQFFNQQKTRKSLEKMRKAGLKFDIVEKTSGGTFFTGKTVVITGTLEKLDRKEAESTIRRLGGHPAGSVSKKTDYVVVGENPGSKVEKAKTLGIAVLNEKEFLLQLKKSGA